MRRLLSAVLVLWLGLLPATAVLPAGARAQDGSASSYEGVSPGSGHPPPAARRLTGRGARARASIITWPGFQAMGDGGSRFFVQTTTPVTTEVRTTSDRVEVVFRNTTIHLANSRRWLETRFFNTPVLRARLERRGRDMVLVMHLRAASTPSVSSAPGDATFTYTYVDFGPGQWLPPEPAPEPTPAGSLGVVSAGPNEPSAQPESPPLQRRDDERPPPVQGPNPKSR